MEVPSRSSNSFQEQDQHRKQHLQSPSEEGEGRSCSKKVASVTFINVHTWIRCNVKGNFYSKELVPFNLHSLPPTWGKNFVALVILIKLLDYPKHNESIKYQHLKCGRMAPSAEELNTWRRFSGPEYLFFKGFKAGVLIEKTKSITSDSN